MTIANDLAPAYAPDEIERMNGYFRPLGCSLLRIHLGELFATMRARLAGAAPRGMARPAEDAIDLRLDTYHAGAAPVVSGVLTDPLDGQAYRLLLVPADCAVRVTRG